MKAAFLVVLGVVILFYADGFVNDLRSFVEDQFVVTWEATWDLLLILLWILVAWLFVDAVLIVALSVTDQRYSLADVMKRLHRIEKKIGIHDQPDSKNRRDADYDSSKAVDESPEEEVPPPPKE